MDYEEFNAYQKQQRQEQLEKELQYDFDVKHPYRCKKCKWEYHLNIHDIMNGGDSPFMPCGHRWDTCLAALRRDYAQGIEEVQI